MIGVSLGKEPQNSLYVDNDSTVSLFNFISLTVVALIQFKKKKLNTQGIT